MKLSHFRQIVDCPAATAPSRLSFTLKNGKNVNGAWSWFNGPGEIIIVGQGTPGNALLEDLLFVEIEQIATISLHR